jgi:alpha-beta hydrolase superfamily lysophospholipase
MTAVVTLVLLTVFSMSAHADPRAITLQAADHVSVSALVYEATKPKAIVLLFHQADSSKAEYATIAPKLANAGYTSLAIDQRSGGTLFGPNDTVAHLAKRASYADAKKDLEAAFDWANSQRLPIILWGSSYSAALVFEVAAEHPNQIAAVLAFSPGEYLEASNEVTQAAAKVSAPIFVTSASSADEVEAARAILSAAPAQIKTQFEPRYGGPWLVHADRNTQSDGSGGKLAPRPSVFDRAVPAPQVAPPLAHAVDGPVLA